MKYKRIIILGGSCSGKSTLANRISSYTGYHAYHLDNLLLNSDWSQKEKSEWLNICKKEFLSKDTGIVDGNYSQVLKERIDWADFIIFIDVSTIVHLYRMLYRIITIKLGIEKRYGNPEGTKSEFSLNFLSWVFNWNRTHRRRIFDLLESIKDKKIVVTNSPKKLDINKLLNK